MAQIPYSLQPAYPTRQHALAAEKITELFSGQHGVETVLLVNSCARGKASADSCLDILVLLKPDNYSKYASQLADYWQSQYPADPVFEALLRVGAYSQVDLEFSNGQFHETGHGWTTGADEFELEIGNTLAYSYPLWEAGDYYSQLRQLWLPYYADEMRARRLQMVIRYLKNNLAHIPLYEARGLYFQSYKRFYHAFEEFLQALFIARRTYPIAYDKWVKEEVVDILGLPELYEVLPSLFEIQRFESQEISHKANILAGLLEKYVEPFV